MDIDGVLVRGREALPGAQELVSGLRQCRLPISLLTNDGNNSIREKKALLNACGLEFAEEEFTSSGHGLAEVVRELKLIGRLFLVVGRLGDPCYARQAGLQVTRDMDSVRKCAGVILGEEDYDWEPAINTIVNLLLGKPETPFFIPNPDIYFPAGGGSIRVAAGGVAQFVQHVLEVYGVEIRPRFLGKPHRPIFQHSHRSLEKRAGKRLPTHRVMMIGDSLHSDIQGAKAFGYRNALVLTGTTTRDLLSRSSLQPDLVFEGL